MRQSSLTHPGSSPKGARFGRHRRGASDLGGFLLVLLVSTTRSQDVAQRPWPRERMQWNTFSDTTPEGLARLRAESRMHSQPDAEGASCSAGLQLIGRWPFGTAWGIKPSDHFAQDHLAFMESGSGIRILDCSNPALPQMVGKVDCASSLAAFPICGTGIVCRDSILYVVSWRSSLEVFDIHNPTLPVKLGGIVLTGPPQGLGVRDTFAFVAGLDSVFRVVNVANPSSPVEVAAVSLPDIGVGVTIKDTIAYAACYHAGLVSVNIARPLSPQVLSSVGGFTASHVVLDPDTSLAYVAGGAGGLRIVSFADPASLHVVGSLTSTPGTDVWQTGMFAYVAGYTNYDADLYIIDISQPSGPTLISHASSPGWGTGVFVADGFGHAYTSDHWEGLHVYDISDPVHPVLDTVLFGASTPGLHQTPRMRDSLVFLPDHWAGLKIISVADPAFPQEIGCYDSAGMNPECSAVAIRDSVAYIGCNFWAPSGLRAINIGDVRHPSLAGYAEVENPVGAMVIRDTLAFLAELYRFQVFSIVRPASPRLLGTCNLTQDCAGLFIRDTLAFVANATSLKIVNIANSSTPAVIGSYSAGADDVFVCDTIAYVAGGGQTYSLSVANPRLPRLICTLDTWSYSVLIDGNTAYCGGDRLRVADVSNPGQIRFVGSYSVAQGVIGLALSDSVLCAAGYLSGLCIFKVLPTGVAETSSSLGAARGLSLECYPQPVENSATVVAAGALSRASRLVLSDPTGRAIHEIPLHSGKGGEYRADLDLSKLGPGVYFLSLNSETERRTIKITKR